MLASLRSKLLALALLSFATPAFAEEPSADPAPADPAEPSDPPAKDGVKHPRVKKARERIKEKCDSDPVKCEEKKQQLKDRIEKRKQKRAEAQ